MTKLKDEEKVLDLEFHCYKVEYHSSYGELGTRESRIRAGCDPFMYFSSYQGAVRDAAERVGFVTDIRSGKVVFDARDATIGL